MMKNLQIINPVINTKNLVLALGGVQFEMLAQLFFACSGKACRVSYGQL